MSKRTIVVMMILVLCAAMAQAGTRADLSGDAVVEFQTTMDMPFMAVGNLGNVDDTEVRYTRTAGGVKYAYNMGKFEVTSGQYVEFLNAVAATDTYGLYRPAMSDITGPYTWACNIQRAGSEGSYTYSVPSDWADRPVNYLNWGDTVRFANWLTNGMPTGAQDLTTTEDGSYFLNGAMTDPETLAVQREPDAKYVLPNMDEWYKAAYHKNDGVTGNYFDYPTSSDTAPTSVAVAGVVVDPDPGNIATHGISPNGGSDWGLGDPYYRTEVGQHENSASPYGVFDMGGNVMEWNEFILGLEHRAVLGGSFSSEANSLHASSLPYQYPWVYHSSYGFRIAEVPEPATMSLLALGACLPLFHRKRR